MRGFLAISTATLCALVACKTRPDSSPPAAPQPAPVEQVQPASDDRPTPQQTGPLLGEANARVILSRRFRTAGFRVMNDVRIQRDEAFDVTVDGYDPQAKVGFEYIDSAELNTDVTDAERAALDRDADYQILIVSPASEPDLIQAIDAFLGQVRSE